MNDGMVLDDLDAAADELTGRDRLYPRLHELIPEHDTVLESTIGSHTRYTAAPIPWNTPAAMLYLDIHAAAREHEANLTLLLWRQATFRGSSDRLTTEIIRRLPVLIRAAHTTGHANRAVVAAATRDLLDWPALTRHVLDEARSHEVPWTPAPGGLRCPHCGRPLWLAPGWHHNAEAADLICRTRDCLDDDGKQRRWAPGAWIARLQTPDAPTTETTDPLDPTRIVTAREAVRIWGLSTDQVYVWKHRGRITSVGIDRDGRDLYANADIAALVIATRQPATEDDTDATPA